MAKSEDAVKYFNEISARTIGKEKFDGLRVALAEIDESLFNRKDLKGQYNSASYIDGYDK